VGGAPFMLAGDVAALRTRFARRQRATPRDRERR
jgi:hypothetical protein